MKQTEIPSKNGTRQKSFTFGITKKTNKETFNSSQKLIIQLLKVLKLRLSIENINLPEETLISLIKQNINLIDIRYLEVSSMNTFVDDLIEIIKHDNNYNIT